MSQSGQAVQGGGGGGGVITIAGDVGSATGSTITFKSTPSSGASTQFNASGAEVDFNVTDGNSNTFIGSNSGSVTGSTLGSTNTALGAATLFSMNNGSATNNTALGYAALALNQTGNVNTAVGASALVNMTGGQGNTSLGASTLQSLTSGNGNIALGTNSLSGLLTGSGNVAIGRGAGVFLNGAETNNTYLNNSGQSGESGVMRLGDDSNTTTAFINGVNGISLSNPVNVAIDSVTKQLGVISPSGTVQYSNDFFEDTTIEWTIIGNMASVASTATHPGLQQIQDSPFGGLVFANNVDSIAVGGGIISSNYVWSLVALSDMTNTYTAYAGFIDLVDAKAGTPPINGIYFSYTDTVNAGNWTINCTNTSVTTSVDSGVAASTGYVNLGFVVNAAGSSVEFFINGVSVGSIATNIPFVAVSPCFLEIRSAGALPGSLIDLFYMTQTLTTSR